MKHPEIFTEKTELKRALDRVRAQGQIVAVVPTMGALHEGHLRLADAAKNAGDYVLVTVFVNPKQFGPNEDFDRYPRDLEGDRAKLAKRGVDGIFAPSVELMYPPEFRTTVSVSELTGGMCGAHRPGHFDGVTTVVAKLFGLTSPCTAIFGRKDYQQLAVIRRMTEDLCLPVEIIGVPTVRDSDGLALSSRNAYLTDEERQRALSLSRGLRAAAAAFSRGERRAGALRGLVAEQVEAATDRVDYITAADPDTLAPLSADDLSGDRLLIAVAAHVGRTRLIDNAVLGEDFAEATP